MVWSSVTVRRRGILRFGMDLLPVDEVRRRLRIIGQSHAAPDELRDAARRRRGAARAHEQQRVLMEESGLARARPDAVIEFARPRGVSRDASRRSRHTATTWPVRAAASYRRPRRWRPTGTTRCTCRALPPCAALDSPTPIRSRPRPTCSSGAAADLVGQAARSGRAVRLRRGPSRRFIESSLEERLNGR
jgi:hypothetical protein